MLRYAFFFFFFDPGDMTKQLNFKKTLVVAEEVQRSQRLWESCAIGYTNTFGGCFYPVRQNSSI